VTKMSKEELRDDPVLDWIQVGVSFAQRNARWLLMGGIIVAAGIVAAITLQKSQGRSEAEAAALLTDAQRRYLQGAYPAAEVQLRQMIEAHGRTAAALPGYIYLGDALLAQGRASEALTAYDEAVARGQKDLLLLAAAHRGKAASLESLSRFADAAKDYEEAAAIATPLQADDMIQAGRNALLAADPTRAQEILQRARKLESGRVPEIDFYLAQAEAQIQLR